MHLQLRPRSPLKAGVAPSAEATAPSIGVTPIATRAQSFPSRVVRRPVPTNASLKRANSFALHVPAGGQSYLPNVPAHARPEVLKAQARAWLDKMTVDEHV